MTLPTEQKVDLSAELPHARPFLKWAGGKSQLLPALLERAPESIDTYYEPFLGGGALFFALMANPALTPRRAVLNDLNHELLTTYTVVRDQLDELFERLEPLAVSYLECDEEARATYYYSIRDEQWDTPIKIAARLIFLNKTCFNGLYRVNQKGRFNVPHGRYKKPNILDRLNLQAVSQALQNTELTTVDFGDCCLEAEPGDFVYLDPPFHPLSDTSSFTAYTDSDFGHEEHLRLKWLIDEMRERDIPVMLSNSPHEWVVGAYEASRYLVERIPARRAINSKADRRGAIDELLVTSVYPRRGAISLDS